MADTTNTTTTESDGDSTEQTDEADSPDTKSVATGGDTRTIDLQDLVDDLEAELEELRERRERAEDGEDVDWPPDEWANVDFPVRACEHSIELIKADIERLGGSEFVIKKARAGEMARAIDLIGGDVSKGNGDPMEHLSSEDHRKVQVCVERVPSGAPTTTDGRLKTPALEDPTFQHLLTCIENLNTYGVVSLDDF